MAYLNSPLSVRSLLVCGGARSGKSAYAQHLAETSGLKPIYIATARIWDDEMGQRVAQHRADRDARWTTVEEPLALTRTIRTQADPDRILLVDCLTLWLTNVMLEGGPVPEACETLASTCAELAGPVIFVSNEVGHGIVPDNALARDFRDAQGRLNQAMAQACEGVIWVAAGIPQVVKPAPPPAIRFRV
ncbi:bifunctional adenosylcobinamide kinase/adenosylcobinamide-phosphate guanylyltransferase [Methylovirgula sp. 4M-Z18]|uniref:bifunctional adenosylcobinamide kinase/adenosylcobinamide-phosphate guanylyltransferase n=1 Tax=Methylovirgula sp. 4M-Z18 TaxID=2293567 RepID=UPI0018F651A9|nr:bifunctional adenosylcobinamide kinase/adenosylcobinamide-phosphate guanylyltransferase [Methylovirgula sp. 4M-Z18]